jgi:hypothetical protein
MQHSYQALFSALFHLVVIALPQRFFDYCHISRQTIGQFRCSKDLSTNDLDVIRLSSGRHLVVPTQPG